jgi:hemerythrin
MELITWKDSFSVGIERIDSQHKSLVEMINDLFRAMSNREDKEFIQPLISNLISYAASHFKDEEQLMQQAGFPDLNNHKREHEDFTLKIKQFQLRHSKGEAALSLEIINFLKEWLLDHIITKDRKYARYMSGK